MQEQQRPKRFYDKYGSEYAVLPEGFSISGGVVASRKNSNIQVAGRIDGNIEVSGVVNVLPGGYCNGSVSAGCIIVSGKIEGELHAREKIELRETAYVHGDVLSPHLAVAEGCQFNGSIHSGSCQRHDFVEKRVSKAKKG